MGLATTTTTTTAARGTARTRATTIALLGLATGLIPSLGTIGKLALIGLTSTASTAIPLLLGALQGTIWLLRSHSHSATYGDVCQSVSATALTILPLLYL